MSVVWPSFFATHFPSIIAPAGSALSLCCDPTCSTTCCQQGKNKPRGRGGRGGGGAASEGAGMGGGGKGGCNFASRTHLQSRPVFTIPGLNTINCITAYHKYRLTQQAFAVHCVHFTTTAETNTALHITYLLWTCNIQTHSSIAPTQPEAFSILTHQSTSSWPCTGTQCTPAHTTNTYSGLLPSLQIFHDADSILRR